MAASVQLHSPVDIPDGAVLRLRALLAHSMSISKAVYVDIIEPGMDVPMPGLIAIAMHHQLDADEVTMIGNEMQPYFEYRGGFCVTTIPDGEWWDEVVKTGVQVR